MRGGVDDHRHRVDNGSKMLISRLFPFSFSDAKIEVIEITWIQLLKLREENREVSLARKKETSGL